MRTTECSWRLGPSAGMEVPTSIPFVSRTRAIFRSAEFGFFGVIVDTRVQTPRFCGAPWSAGVFVFSRLDVRPLRISWLTVGMSPCRIEKRSYTDEKVGKGTGPLPNQGGMVAKLRGPSTPRALLRSGFAAHRPPLMEHWSRARSCRAGGCPRRPRDVPRHLDPDESLGAGCGRR